MVDFGAFVDSLPWLVPCPSDPEAPLSSSDGVNSGQTSPRPNKQVKRTMLSTERVFEGKCCFLVSGSIIALELGADVYAYDALLEVDSANRLLFQLNGGSHKLWIDHTAIYYLRRSRPCRHHKDHPPFFAFDFGLIQIRFWDDERKDVSLEVFSQLHDMLKPDDHAFKAWKVPKGKGTDACSAVSDAQALEIIRGAVEQVEMGVRSSDPNRLREGISEIIKVANVLGPWPGVA